MAPFNALRLSHSANMQQELQHVGDVMQRSALAALLINGIRKQLRPYCDEELHPTSAAYRQVVHDLSVEVVQRSSELMDLFHRDVDEDGCLQVPIGKAEKSLEQVVNAVVEQWYRGRSEHHVHEPVHPENSHIADILGYLETAAPSAPLRRQYDRVRSATYTVMLKDHVPLVGEMYDAALLKPDIVSHLYQYDTTKFQEEVGKGKFVWGFHERSAGDGSSVSEELLQHLPEHPSDRSSRMEGRLLFDPEKKKPISFLTHWRNADVYNKDDPEVGDATDYLRHGVTGGRMRYRGSPGFGYFRNEAEMGTLLRFCDICSNESYGASRLIHQWTRELKRDIETRQRRQINNIILYRLHELLVSPKIPASYQSGIPLAYNLKSQDFFHVRGFKGVATDMNQDGPASRREITIDGKKKEIQLSPVWEVLNGSFPSVHNINAKIWRAIQLQHADFSMDEGILKYGIKS